MNPVFVHDPRRGAALHDRFDLSGNPDIDKDWTTTSISYVENGQPKLKDVALTPAYFAHEETRFKKQFRLLKDDAAGLPVEEYINLKPADRAGKVPFVWSVDDNKNLVKLEILPTIVQLVEERRKYWRTLQYLAGRHVERMDSDHRTEVEALRQQYQDSQTAQESALDTIARAMSELAVSSQAPSPGGIAAALAPFGGAPAAATAAAPAAAAKGNGADVAHIRDEEMAKCTNCKNCYQQVPELFELTRIVVDGVTKEVAHTKPGALEKVQVTPDLKARLARVAAACDAEIVR